MPRAVWKGPLFLPFNLNVQPIKTDFRACQILPQFIGKSFLVHSGKDYVPLKVSKQMVGHRLGEFVRVKYALFMRKCPSYVFSMVWLPVYTKTSTDY